MPDDLFQDKDQLLGFIKSKDDEAGYSLYDTSDTVTSCLFVIPPGPSKADNIIILNENYWSDRVDSGFSSIQPRSMEPENVGSNTGLLSVFARWRQQRLSTAGGASRYGVVVADINIYIRLLKVPMLHILTTILAKVRWIRTRDAHYQRPVHWSGTMAFLQDRDHQDSQAVFRLLVWTILSLSTS